MGADPGHVGVRKGCRREHMRPQQVLGGRSQWLTTTSSHGDILGPQAQPCPLGLRVGTDYRTPVHRGHLESRLLVTRPGHTGWLL